MKSLWIPLGCALLLVAGLCPAVADSPYEVMHPVKDETTLDALRHLCEHGDVVSRSRAVRALGEIADPADADRIAQRLADPDALVRVAALSAAARRGLAMGPEEFASFLESHDDRLRSAALGAVAEGLPVELEPARLVEMLDDPVAAVRFQAARALVASGGVRLKRAQNCPDPRAQGELLKGCLAGEERDEALTWALQSEFPLGVTLALQALQPVDTRWVSSVEAQMFHPVSAVAVAAVEAAGRVPDPTLRPALLRRLEGAEAGMRGRICIALAGYPGETTIAALAGEVGMEQDILVQQSALEALRRIGSPTALDVVAQAVQDSRHPVRIAALDAALAWDDAAAGAVFLTLQNRESDEEWIRVLEGLYRFRPEGMAVWIPSLNGLLQNNHHLVQAGAIRLLGLLGDRGVLPRVLASLKQPKLLEWSELRLAGWKALTHLQVTDQVDLALRYVTTPVLPPPPMMMDPLYETDEVRREALAYVERGAGADTPDQLLAGLVETPSLELCVTLAEALSRMTGASWEPLPRHRYRSWFTESLGSQDIYRTPTPPGIVTRPVAAPPPSP